MHGLSLGAFFANGHFSGARAGHSHHSHHSHRSEGHDHHGRLADRQSQAVTTTTNGGGNQSSVKQVLVNQIKVVLNQQFNVRQSSVTVAGATADEQAASDLAGTVSSTLNTLNGSGATPDDAVAVVSDAANSAIQQTSQDLAGGNAANSSTSLSDAVAQIQGQLQSLFSAYLDQSNTSQGADSVAATGAKLISNAKGVLEIHTQEGDTITLGFASKTGATVQSLQASSGGTQLSGNEIQAFSQNRVTISVQGDLNAGEMQAVQDLVGQVNQLANQFFGGDASAALSQAGSLNFDGSQLTDYSLHLALKQTFEAYGLNLVQTPAVTDEQTPAAANDPAPSTPAANDSTATATSSIATNNGAAANTKST